MREIQLTQGKYALVDNEDYDYLSQWKWYAYKCKHLYYAGRSENSKVNGKHRCRIIRMHRVIMSAKHYELIDHKNRNGLDNRKNNLRFASYRINALNKNNNKKYPGVEKTASTYRARITIRGKYVHIGRFNTQEQAYNAYLCKVAELESQVIIDECKVDQETIEKNLNLFT